MFSRFHNVTISHKRRQGFTLLEMSIVLVIIGVILAGGAVTFGASIQQRQYNETKDKLTFLQKTLRDYWLTFGRLPCPADISTYNNLQTAGANNNFGKETTATNGACTGAQFVYNRDTGTTANCDYSDSNHMNCTYGGMIPTKTLQLPDDYAFDGWGRRIFYAVDSDFITTSPVYSAAALPVTDDVTNSTSRIIVRTSNGDDKTSMGAYVVLSFGPNGHGAYSRYSSTTRLSAGSANANELQNCHCSAAGVSSTFNQVFVQAPYSTDTSSITNTFDDLLVYGTRGTLSSPKE
jgi:prepilin-type N-terminal cleavage/methylation domain-containing protein